MLIDDAFVFKVATQINKGNDDEEPRSIDKCRQRDDWPKWRDAIQAGLNSLDKRGVFEPIEPTLEDVKSVGSKWILIRKRN